MQARAIKNKADHSLSNYNFNKQQTKDMAALVCSTDCTPPSFGALPTQLCENLEASEIYAIIIQGAGTTGPVDAAVAADWAGLIDQADATGAKMKVLVGKGSIPEPEKTKVTVSRYASKTVATLRTLTFTVYSVSDPLVYDYLRVLQCNKTNPRVWPVSMAQNVFFDKMPGATVSDRGIETIEWDVSFPKAEGREGVEMAVLKITFADSRLDPDRVKLPIALTSFIS